MIEKPEDVAVHIYRGASAKSVEVALAVAAIRADRRHLAAVLLAAVESVSPLEAVRGVIAEMGKE